MSYYDHITALRLRTGQWANPRPLRSHERELAEMQAQHAARSCAQEEPARQRGGNLAGWFRFWARPGRAPA